MATQLTLKAEVDQFRGQLEARTTEFSDALPSHIRSEHFQRAAVTAVNQNPALLQVDRRSLLNALMRCASDGLIPDGRQAAMVIFKSASGPVAQYMQMVAGVRHLVQQSGEITRFEQVVAYENDKFRFRLGDHPKIEHEPALDNRGNPIAVYSVAQFRDGSLSRDVMTVEEIEKVRNVSRTKDSGPWVQWWSEMAKKTIAKRHAKMLPMSSDAAMALARDDAEHSTVAPPSHQVVDFTTPTSRPRLAEKLDAISQPTPRRRGRPKAEAEAAPDMVPDLPPPDDPVPDVVELDLVPDDGWPGPRHDFDQGVKDKVAGRAGCLVKDIREDPARFAEWQKGFTSVARP